MANDGRGTSSNHSTYQQKVNKWESEDEFEDEDWPWDDDDEETEAPPPPTVCLPRTQSHPYSLKERSGSHQALQWAF